MDGRGAAEAKGSGVTGGSSHKMLQEPIEVNPGRRPLVEVSVGPLLASQGASGIKCAAGTWDAVGPTRSAAKAGTGGSGGHRGPEKGASWPV